MQISLRRTSVFLAALAGVIIFAFAMLAVPHFAAAQDSSALPSGGLVPCGQDGPLTEAGKQACGFPELLILVGRIIRFLIFYVAPIIAIVVLLWGGFLILTSGASPGEREKAYGMFRKAIVGLVIAMCAWLIVRFVLVQLGVDTNVFPVFY